MGFLEAADLHLVKHWGRYLWFQAAAEKHGQSSIPPWREALAQSSVWRQGIVQEVEEQWDEYSIWVEQVSFFSG